MDEFFSTVELASRLGRSPRTARRVCAAGVVPAFKRGRVWCIPATALQQFSLALALGSARALAKVSSHSPAALQHADPMGGGVEARSPDTGLSTPRNNEGGTRDE